MADEVQALEIDFPRRTSGRWGRFSSADWQFAVVCLCMTVFVNHFLGKGAAFMVLVTGGVLLVPLDYGRAYTLAGQYLRIWWLSMTRKGVVWSSDEKLRITHPEPIGLGVVDLGGLGLLHTADNHDAVVVTAEGSGLASLDLSGQFESHLALAEIIRKVAAMHETRGYNVGWGWVYRTRPLNVDRMHSDWLGYLHDEALIPSALKKPESDWTPHDRRWVGYGENLQQLLDTSYKFAREVTMAAVCVVPRQGFDKELPETGFQRLPVVQTAKVITTELEGGGLLNPQALSPRQMHAYLRCAWDIKHINDYYEWQLKSTDDEVLASDSLHPRSGIRAGGDYLEIDGTYTSVIWVKGFEGRMLPYRLRQLSAINVPFLSVAMLGSTRSSGLEYAWLDRATALSEEAENFLGIVHHGPKAVDKKERRLSRQRKIYESRYSQDFNILVAVHHLSREELDDAVEEALKSIRLANMTGERVTGNIRQLPFALSAATGVDFVHL
jgi:hypothetical protein